MDENIKPHSQNNVQPTDETSSGNETELEKCKKERDEYLASWQRARADYVNYKKDELTRIQELARYQTEDMIKELIVVLDNFDLGLRVLEKNGSVDKGVYMIRTQIADLLKKRGLERILVKPGDQFNPSIAEAVAEADSELPEGAIIEEIEPGYRFHDKILRAARVIISKGNKSK